MKNAVLAALMASAVFAATGMPMAAPLLAAAQATPNCVTIGAPKPALSYVYRYSDTQGSTEFTNQWKQFSATGSQLVTTRAAAQSTYVSKHSVADDVFVLESSVASGR